MKRKVGRIVKVISCVFCLLIILGCNVQTAMAHSLYNNENVIDQHYMGGISSLVKQTSNNIDESENAGEEQLMQLLESRVFEPIVNFIYDDFDNNGVYEAIAFCGEYSSMENVYSGTPYLVTREGVQRIREEDIYSNAGVVYDFGNTKIISITKHYATSSVSYYYKLDGTEVREIDGSGFGELYQDEYGNMCMTDSQYDAMVDGTGHTWNVYYFYWDDGLKEYGGTEISQEEFLQYDGADSIINTILSDGYDISTIYRRANRIININCCDGYCNKNVRVLLKKGSVSVFPVEEYSNYQEGIIKQALVPEIATYNEVQEEPEEIEEVTEQEEEVSSEETVIPTETEESYTDQEETQDSTDADNLSEKKYIPQNGKAIVIILIIEIPILIGLFIKLKK